MMNQDAGAAGSVEVAPITTKNALREIVPTGSALTIKATHTNPCSVSSRDLPYLHPEGGQLKKHSVTPPQYPLGAASACVTTQGMKK